MKVTNFLNLARLPAELWYHIFSFITDKNDLRHLCLASKIFLPESRRLLYRHVQLKGRTAVVLWTDTILSSEFHAKLVFSLTIPTRAKLMGYYERALAKCMEILSNLEELNISHAMTVNSMDDYLIPTQLEDCFKRLRTFRIDLEDVGFNRDLFLPDGFYELHPLIEKLYVTSKAIRDFIPPHFNGEVPSETFPILNTLHVENTEIAHAFRAKPIQRLRIGRVILTQRNIDELMVVLAPFQDTLVSLCVGLYESAGTAKHDEQINVASFIEQLAKCMPELVHLCILADVTVEVCFLSPNLISPFKDF